VIVEGIGPNNGCEEHATGRSVHSGAGENLWSKLSSAAFASGTLPYCHSRAAQLKPRRGFLNPTPTPAASAVLHRQTPFHLAAYSRGHFTFRAVRRVEMTHFSALLAGSHEPIAYYYHSRG
jgi:hypothetical protein